MTAHSRSISAAGAVAYHAGLSAEAAVARHYQRSGRPVIAERWRGESGEIDLVASEQDCLVFIEVKKARSFGAAAQRVSDRQKTRIYNAASEYLAHVPTGQDTVTRFDIALVDAAGRIEILENALGF